MTYRNAARGRPSQRHRQHAQKIWCKVWTRVSKDTHAADTRTDIQQTSFATTFSKLYDGRNSGQDALRPGYSVSRSCYLVVAISDVLVELALAVEDSVAHVDQFATGVDRSVHLKQSHHLRHYPSINYY